MRPPAAAIYWGCDLSYSDHLKTHFEALGLPDDASEWMLGVWNLWQVFDDFADNGAVHRDEMDAALWFSQIGSCTNPFFMRNAGSLLPVLAVQIQKWQASDLMERAGQADERSYMWRAGYYDLLLLVTHLATGVTREKAAAVLSLYGETFQQYREEFPHA